MTLGYGQPLYVLAFDHRASFERDLFHASHPISAGVRAEILKVKEVIYDGFVEAIERGLPAEAAGVLVDEQYGSAVARKAKAAGHLLAMPVEKSGQPEFEFQYGEDFGAHIDAFDPTFSKVLVRYNPDGDAALNRRQTERLALLTAWLHERGRTFLFELLVPATEAQLNEAGGDRARYDRDIRPKLVVRTIEALQGGGVEPDIWKIEGLDTSDACTKVVAAARRGGRDGVACIVLGRGADESKVLSWLRVAAGVPGFQGFAVGRTIWETALQDLISGKAARPDAVHTIANHYLEMFEGFTA